MINFDTCPQCQVKVDYLDKLPPSLQTLLSTIEVRCDGCDRFVSCTKLQEHRETCTRCPDCLGKRLDPQSLLVESDLPIFAGDDSVPEISTQHDNDFSRDGPPSYCTRVNQDLSNFFHKDSSLLTRALWLDFFLTNAYLYLLWTAYALPFAQSETESTATAIALLTS